VQQSISELKEAHVRPCRRSFSLHGLLELIPADVTAFVVFTVLAFV